ncbi:hypothetical protein HED60_19965 [Planctomycetales bacterium ZRK34]|nr:hypothetical protein HED60_19965 [Planctomycetales bacterium ZRK34]
MCALIAMISAVTPARAANLVVGLDDGDAIFSATTAASTTVSSGSIDHAAGVSFAVEITPDANDISASLVSILEIGGPSNGAGLYLLNGTPLFISKSSTNDQNGPSGTAPYLDLDGGSEGPNLANNIAVSHSVGTLTAGQTYKMSVVLDNTDGNLEFIVDNDLDGYQLSNVASGWAWSGNDTVNYLGLDPVGSRGGLNDLNGDTDVDSASAFSGTGIEGRLWNATPNDNLYDIPPSTIHYDGEAISNAANSQSVGNPNHGQGLLFNIAFAPSSADLTGTVLLMEVGGTSNGSGLYLVDGVPVFLSKQDGGSGNVPTGLNDTDFTDGNDTVAVSHSFGELDADVEYVLAAMLNTNTGQLILTLRDGLTGDILTDLIQLTGEGPTKNWSGNDTLSVGFNNSINPSGDRGALNGVNNGNPFYYDTVADFTGYLDRATYANIFIPTPAALPGGLALLATLVLRRRRA